MIAPDRPVLWVARMVLEAASPLSIGTGRGIGTYDTAVVADANGLPTIPATSLKGVLRATCRTAFDPDMLNDVFGYADGEDGVPARLSMSWGWCHDRDDTPVLGRLAPRYADDPRFSPSGDLADPVLRFLLATTREATVVRDRVRIGPRGSVDGTGKFDRTVVPRGVRFTVEIQLNGHMASIEDDRRTWNSILGILASGDLSVGGSTRGGLGKLVPVSDSSGLRISERCFVLDRGGFSAYRNFRRAGAENGDLDLLDRISPAPVVSGGRRLTVPLEAIDTWRIGGGAVAVGGEEVDAVPLRETHLDWGTDGRRAHVVDAADARCVVIPATSIKGALRHRTAFHIRRYIGGSAPGVSDRAASDPADGAIGDLFGSVKAREATERPKSEGSDGAGGRSGSVMIDDAVLDLTDCAHQRIAHVSIDRFTGGARQGLLFDEEVLVGGRLDLHIRLLPRFEALPEVIRNAFFAALDDLQTGRLALGAASGRGHGRFRKASSGDAR